MVKEHRLLLRYSVIVLCLCLFNLDSYGASLASDTLAISDFAKTIDRMCQNSKKIDYTDNGNGSFKKVIVLKNDDQVHEEKTEDGIITLQYKTNISRERFFIESSIKKYSNGDFKQKYYTQDYIIMTQKKVGNCTYNSILLLLIIYGETNFTS